MHFGLPAPTGRPQPGQAAPMPARYRTTVWRTTTHRYRAPGYRPADRGRFGTVKAAPCRTLGQSRCWSPLQNLRFIGLRRLHALVSTGDLSGGGRSEGTLPVTAALRLQCLVSLAGRRGRGADGSIPAADVGSPTDPRHVVDAESVTSAGGGAVTATFASEVAAGDTLVCFSFANAADATSRRSRTRRGRFRPGRRPDRLSPPTPMSSGTSPEDERGRLWRHGREQRVGRSSRSIVPRVRGSLSPWWGPFQRVTLATARRRRRRSSCSRR